MGEYKPEFSNTMCADLINRVMKWGKTFIRI